jgi:hypothetical protein
MDKIRNKYGPEIITLAALVLACIKKMSFRRNKVTEKSLKLLNRFLPAVEMTNHEPMQADTITSAIKYIQSFLPYPPLAEVSRSDGGGQRVLM